MRARVRKLYLIGIPLAVFSAVFLGYYDATTIAGWGCDLLDAIRQGQLRSFQEVTIAAHGVASNYALSVNLLTALWLLPLYFIDHLAGIGIAFPIYVLWYKGLVLAEYLAGLRLFDRLLGRLSFSEEKRRMGDFLFAGSAILLITVVGAGQVDGLSMVFLLAAAHAFLDERYYRLSLLGGLAVLTKPLAILAIVPVILLLYSRQKRRFLLDMVLCALPYLFDLAVTRLLIPDYRMYLAELNRNYAAILGMTRLQEIFATQTHAFIVASIAAALVICYGGLKLAVEDRVRPAHYIAMPALLFLSYGFFVSPTTYWFANILPLVILAYLLTDPRGEDDAAPLLFAGINGAVVLIFLFHATDSAPSLSLSWLSLIGGERLAAFRALIHTSETTEMIGQVGFTFYIVCMLLVIVPFLVQTWKLDGDRMRERAKKPLAAGPFARAAGVITILPVILYDVIMIGFYLAG